MHFFRKISLFLSKVCLFLLFLLLLCYGFSQTELVKKPLRNLLEKKLSHASGKEVVIDQFSCFFPFSLHIGKITFIDKEESEKKPFQLENIDFSWSFSKPFRKKLHFFVTTPEFHVQLTSDYNLRSLQLKGTLPGNHQVSATAYRELDNSFNFSLLNLSNQSMKLDGDGFLTSDLSFEESYFSLKLTSPIDHYLIDFQLSGKLHSPFLQGKVFSSSTDSSFNEADFFLGLSEEGVNGEMVTNEKTRFTLTFRNALAELLITNQEGMEWVIKSDLSSENRPFSIRGKGYLKTFFSEPLCYSDDLQLVMDGEWYLDKKGIALFVQNFTGLASTHRFHLSEPTHLTLAGGEILLSPFSLSVGKGVLSGHATASFDDLMVQLSAKDFPLEMLRLFYSHLPLLGNVTGEISLEGDPAAPSGELTLSLLDIQYCDGELGDYPPLSGKILAKLSPGELSLFCEELERPIRFEATLPLSFSFLPFEWEWDLDRPFSSDLLFKGELTPLLHLLVPDYNRIKATLDSDLHFFGSLSHPKAHGSCLILDGSYESLHSGSLFKEVRAKIIAEEELLSLREIKATDGGAGKVTGSGSLLLSLEKLFPYNAILHLEDAALLRKDSIEGSCDGRLQLSGNFAEATLAGELFVNKTDITLVEGGGSSGAPMEVIFPKKQQILKRKLPNRFFRLPLNLDLNVDGGNHIFINGGGLRSQWEGSLEVTNSIGDPKVLGSLNLLKGSYSFSGKNFLLREGGLTFYGDPIKDSFLNVVAELHLDDIKVRATLSGPLSAPVLHFLSEPALPLNEILARILFNCSVDEISSPFQMFELTQLIMEVTEGEKSLDIFSKVKNQVGIDQIALQETGSDHASLRVGKYLSNGTLLSLEKQIYSNEHQLSVESNLSSRLRLQAEVSNNSEGKMFLKWKRDY